MKFIVAIPYLNGDGIPDVAMYSEDADTPMEAAHKVWKERLASKGFIGSQLHKVITRVAAAKAGRLGDYNYMYTYKPS